MALPSKRAIRVRIVFAVIGLIVGFSIPICFASNAYRNYNVALWGALSGCFAATTLWLHVKYSRGSLQSWTPRLRTFMLTGCFVQLAGVCGIVTYITLGIALRQSLTPYDDGYYLTSVWCFMTWKWGFMLFWYSRSYLRILTQSEYKPLRSSVHGQVSQECGCSQVEAASPATA
ncbi:PREDICTED: heme transporter HRG1-like [Priapulus caudatus]|uniref:Heme transporter HRG1-like n=1 Tax=Priapulus caudatus TaxID=37621 RepID=A0ABM1DR58_PRICU|nr:PREDICTED: heme transporter HRG1-like [Priapulus caudatus]